MSNYFSKPLRLRLEAYKRNVAAGTPKLGGGWYDPAWDTTKTSKENLARGARWHWVPSETISTGLISGESHHGTLGGEPFNLKGSSTELRYVEDLGGHFRNVRPCHEIVRLEHTGWYVDQFQDKTCHGLVMQLPGRDGKPIYLYGVNDPWNKNTGMVAWRRCEWTDDQKEAARWADDMAKHYAETCREDNAKQQAEQDIEEARNQIKELRLEAKQLVREIKDHRRQNPKAGALSSFSPAICSALKAQIKSLREESHELYKRITEREDNYWTAVEN